MTAPQIIKTPTGDELVVLTRAEYDALVAIAEDAAEDAADAALATERMAEIAAGAGVMTAEESGALLIRDGYLRAARKTRNLTQAQLAQAAGVAQGYLSDIEAGRRRGSPDTLGKIATALGLPVGQFV